jgi:hypothetical protein
LDNIALLANDIAQWLTRKSGVNDVQPPRLTPASAPRSRFSRPPFRPAPAQPAFELRFTFKGEHRVFRYFIEEFDDATTARQMLQVHTNGNLLIRVPNDAGVPMHNDIYYGNRTEAAAALGKAAPSV